MKKLSVCSAVLLLVCGACASDEPNRRPAATPATEPEPRAHVREHERTHGAEVEAVKTADVPADADRRETQARAEAPDSRAHDDVQTADDHARHAADNTRHNVTDRHDTAVTPLDQGNHTSDLEIARKIRQAVTGDDSLSLEAKNVKIISEEGEVTLRGSVKTDSEKRTIENYARQTVGAGHVHNELAAKH